MVFRCMVLGFCVLQLLLLFFFLGGGGFVAKFEGIVLSGAVD
jgi:hypothetical protein